MPKAKKPLFDLDEVGEVVDPISEEDMETMEEVEVSKEEKESFIETNDYFDVVEEGDIEGNSGYLQNDLKDHIIPLWEKSKKIPKEEWVKIRLLKPVCDPTVALKQQDDLMKATEAIKDKPRLALNLGNWKTIQSAIWKAGTILRVPKPIADFYLSLNYTLGYEGFGDPSLNSFGDKSQIGKPVIQRTAELVK